MKVKLVQESSLSNNVSRPIFSRTEALKAKPRERERGGSEDDNFCFLKQSNQALREKHGASSAIFVCLVLCLLAGDYRGRRLRRSPPRLRESSLGITGWLSMPPLSKLAFPNMPFMTNACKDLASSRKYPSQMQA